MDGTCGRRASLRADVDLQESTRARLLRQIADVLGISVAQLMQDAVDDDTIVEDMHDLDEIVLAWPLVDHTARVQIMAILRASLGPLPAG